MHNFLSEIPFRILVTGTRGKSSLVRLLACALCACGIDTRSRITGVIPRELSCSGSRVIRRNSPAHISEMRWWLEQIPQGTQAIVAENSAVSPELQPVAASLLSPTLVVLTNCRPDHEDAWGPGVENAKKAIFAGIPKGVPVISGEKNNLSLAIAACSFLNLPPEKTIPAMSALPPDIADFRIIDIEGARVAFAFSANEPVSTDELFVSTGWRSEETILLFHHRLDREFRLRNFMNWIELKKWKKIIFTRDKKPFFDFSRQIKWHDDIFSWANYAGEQIFGCGNVAGYPLELVKICGQ